MTLSTWYACHPQQSGGSMLQHISDYQASSSATCDSHVTSSPARERLSCMSPTLWSLSGECQQMARTYSAGWQSLLMTHSNRWHCQWHQLACWWRHVSPISWHISMQTAMNWDVFNYRTTWDQVTPWSHKLEHLLSVFTIHNPSNGRWLKSTLEVKCCVSSVVHV